MHELREVVDVVEVETHKNEAHVVTRRNIINHVQKNDDVKTMTTLDGMVRSSCGQRLRIEHDHVLEIVGH